MTSSSAKPLVSVYIPTRNRSHLLARAVNSVLAQTYRNIEVLVADDGSNDDTPRLMADICRQHQNVRYLRADVPSGAPSARNRAIAASRGVFLTGLDDDDEFTPDRITAFLHDWYARSDKGESFSCLYALDEMRARTRRWTPVKPRTVTWDDLSRSNAIGNQVFTTRSNLVGAGLFDEDLRMWQDLDCWIRLTRKCGPAKRTNAVTYVFYVGSVAHRISSQGKDSLQTAFERIARKYALLVPGGMGDPSIRSLYLQMYSSYYGTPVRWTDLKAFVTRFGFPFWDLMRLLKAGVKNEVRAVLRPR